MTKVFFKTFGCTLNFSDTEMMHGLLVDLGFEIVDDPDDSEVVVINTCAVKKPTENKFFNYLEKIRQFNRPIVITGCIAQAMPEKLKDYSLVGPDNINSIVEVIEETMHNNPQVMIEREGIPRLNQPKVRKNKIIEIIPICKGCLGECSYCIVKYARGDFQSYEKSEIIKQAEMAVLKGAKEIWVTAQDTGCYGKDIASSLPELLKELIKINGDFFIRVGMMNPNQVLGMLDELIDVYKDPKIFKFLHIPVQSGNDEILTKMQRKYSVSEFKEIINRFRHEIPDITISTDIICGYPGEKNEQFQDSVDLINEIRPDVLNISRFWSRPKTKASKLFPLSGEETKKRSRKLTSVFDWTAFENNKKWRNWEGTIIIDEKGKNDSWIGRNSSYKPVIVEGDYSLGQKINVRIEHVSKHDLRGLEI